MNKDSVCILLASHYKIKIAALIRYYENVIYHNLFLLSTELINKFLCENARCFRHIYFLISDYFRSNF